MTASNWELVIVRAEAVAVAGLLPLRKPTVVRDAPKPTGLRVRTRRSACSEHEENEGHEGRRLAAADAGGEELNGRAW